MKKDDLLYGNGFELPRRVCAAASRPAAVALSPLVRQARRVRKRMPSLPEARGERSGLELAADATDLVRLLVVGDSTAAGVGVAHMREALPPQLAAILAERRGCPVAWTVSARTGATASFTARELVPGAPFGQDISVVLVGVNDALRMTPRRTWRASMDRLVDALQEHVRPGGQIVLAGLPNLGQFRTFPQPLRAVLGWHGRGLDRELRQIARCRPVVTRVAMPPVSWPEMFAKDRFHPNAAAYRALAAHFAAALTTHAKKD
jgi:lysophospholipase L1-like esterase